MGDVIIRWDREVQNITECGGGHESAKRLVVNQVTGSDARVDSGRGVEGFGGPGGQR